MTTKVHAAVYEYDEKIQIGPLCKTRECAEQSVSPFEGRTVVAFLSGTLEALPEPIMGMHYALNRSKA